MLPTTSSKNLSKIKGQKQDEESNSYLRIELLSIISTYVLILALLIKWVNAHKYLGTIAVKCKKKIAFWNVNFFCLKLFNSSRKPIKKLLHLKMLTLQNVKFKMSEYSNTTIVFYAKNVDGWYIETHVTQFTIQK